MQAIYLRLIPKKRRRSGARNLGDFHITIFIAISSFRLKKRSKQEQQSDEDQHQRLDDNERANRDKKGNKNTDPERERNKTDHFPAAA